MSITSVYINKALYIPLSIHVHLSSFVVIALPQVSFSAPWMLRLQKMLHKPASREKFDDECGLGEEKKQIERRGIGKTRNK